MSIGCAVRARRAFIAVAVVYPPRMMRASLRGLALLALGLGAVLPGGCGVDRAPDSSPAASSQIVLAEPPAVGDTGMFGEDHRWTLEDDATAVAFLDVVDGSESTLAMTGAAQALVVDVWRDLTMAAESQDEYLIIGGIDAAGRFSLARFHDSNADGLPDASTETVLLQQAVGERAYITSISRSSAGDRVYLLDRRSQDIRVAIDTNADSFPDSLNAVAYALSQFHPHLLHSSQIVAGESGEVAALLQGSWFDHGERYMAAWEYPFLSLDDTDLDDVADRALLMTWPDLAKVVTPADWGAPLRDMMVGMIRKIRGFTARATSARADGDDARALEALDLALFVVDACPYEVSKTLSENKIDVPALRSAARDLRARRQAANQAERK